MRSSRLTYIVLTLFVFLTGCHSPISSTSTGSGSSGLVISFTTASSRTLVADLSSSVSYYMVTLGASTTKVNKGDTISISSLTVGSTYTISATAYNSDDKAIAYGSTTKTIQQGNNTVSLTLSGTKTGTGGYSFSFTVPVSTSITTVSAVLYDISGNTISTFTPTLSSATDSSGIAVLSGTIAKASGVNSGYYRLELTFRRGGSSGTIAGIYGEGITIWDNMISNQWLNSSGTLASLRAFTSDEFNSTNSYLSNLSMISSGSTLLLSPVFSSNTISYKVSAPTISFVPVQAMDGQVIQYQLGSSTGSWTTINSGAASSSLTVPSAGTVLYIKVTATDQTSYTIYTFTLYYPTATSTSLSSDGSATISVSSSSASYTLNIKADSASDPTSFTITSISSSAWGTVTIPSYIEIPSSVGGIAVTSIGADAFKNCTAISSITIPSTITSIGDYAFYGCQDLTTITLPSGLVSIGAYAFASISNISTLTIPSSVTSIGEGAFSNDGGLTSVDFECALTSIAAKTFYQCWKLTSITIPDSVVSIGDSAFYSCTALASVTVSSTSALTTLGNAVFQGCGSLASFYFPSKLTSLGDYAFYGTGLTTLSLPAALTSIGAYTFNNLYSLKTVILPASVISLGSYAFNSCSQLATIYANSATPPALGSSVFPSVYGMTIKVPSASLSNYKTSWSSYSSYITSQ